MAKCETGLREAAKSVEPTPNQKAGAVRSHNFLRNQLRLGKFGERIVTSYLSGSYARGTAITPLDDVDIIFVIDASFWGSQILSSRPRPDELLKSFARAVRYRYPESSVRLQRRSVCLQLNHIALDIVPAIEVDKAGTLIEIPDREAGAWIRTNPRAHSDYASRVNQVNAKRLKPVVKLLKYWNSELPSTARLKSFAIETLATRVFEYERISSIQDGLLRFFDFIVHLDHQPAYFQWESRYGVSIKYPLALPDASGISNLLAHTDRAKIGRFVAQAKRSRNLFLEANEAKSEGAAWKRVASALKYPS